MGTTGVRAVGDALVGAMEARGFWIGYVLWTLRRLVVADVFGLAREDTAAGGNRTLWLGGSRAVLGKDIICHRRHLPVRGFR